MRAHNGERIYLQGLCPLGQAQGKKPTHGVQERMEEQRKLLEERGPDQLFKGLRVKEA